MAGARGGLERSTDGHPPPTGGIRYSLAFTQGLRGAGRQDGIRPPKGLPESQIAV